MKKRSIITVILSSMLSCALFGCAVVSTGTGTATATTGAATVVEETVEEVAEVETKVETEAAPEEKEIIEIDVALADVPGVADNAAAIVAKMNEITEEKIGIRANITWLPFGEYGKSLGLLLASGESVDLASQISRAPGNLTTLYANGQLRDISKILPENAPDLIEAVGEEYLNAYRINGGLYGVPTLRDYGSSTYMIMRRDILDELGLTEKAENASTWAEIEEILKAVTENTKLAGVGGGQTLLTFGSMLAGDKLADSYAYDNLQDSNYMIISDQEGNVSSLIENDDFKAMVGRYQDWWNKGYVYKDSPITVDHPDMAIKAGVLFSEIQISEIGVEASKESTTGYPMLAIPLCKNFLTSNFVAKFGTVFPVTGEEPEAAARWLNELYTNPDLMNLLDWGEEGIDYQIVDGEACFVDGQNVDTVRFHNKDYVTGNYFLALPWSGQGADFRNIAMDDLKSYDVSRYLGFSPDMSALENEIAALNSVYLEYFPSISCGNYTDEKYEEYSSKLYTAGLQDYIDAFQNQISAWMEGSQE